MISHFPSREVFFSRPAVRMAIKTKKKKNKIKRSVRMTRQKARTIARRKISRAKKNGKRVIRPRASKQRKTVKSEPRERMPARGSSRENSKVASLIVLGKERGYITYD